MFYTNNKKIVREYLNEGIVVEILHERIELTIDPQRSTPLMYVYWGISHRFKLVTLYVDVHNQRVGLDLTANPDDLIRVEIHIPEPPEDDDTGLMVPEA